MQRVSGFGDLSDAVPYRSGREVLWPDGPQTGVYVAYEEVALARFLQSFFVATGWCVPVYVDGMLQLPNGLQLGGKALESEGFRRLSRGGVVVFAPSIKEEADRAVLHGVIRDAWFTATNLDRRCVVYVPWWPVHEARKLVEQALRDAMTEEEMEMTFRGELDSDGNISPRDLAPDPMPCTGWLAKGIGRELTQGSRVALRAAVNGHSRGLILVGASGHDDHGVEPLVGALIAMTNAIGAPAYVAPEEPSTGLCFGRQRGLQHLELPAASSIKAALKAGFKRLVVELDEGFSSELLHSAQQALVIVVCNEASVQAMKGFPDPYSLGFDCLRPHVLAAVAVGALDVGELRLHTTDLYVKPEFEEEQPAGRWYETPEHREVRWENQLQQFFDAARDEPARARLAATVCDVFGSYADTAAFLLKNGFEGNPRSF